jgi:hypothetical protein
MESSDNGLLSTGLESIFINTLWGRLLSHRQEFMSQKQQSGIVSTHVRRRHGYLAAIATRRAELFARSVTEANLKGDPAIHFAVLLVEVVLLHLHQMTGTMSHGFGLSHEDIEKSNERASAAARRILDISKHLLDVSPWRV